MNTSGKKISGQFYIRRHQNIPAVMIPGIIIVDIVIISAIRLTLTYLGSLSLDFSLRHLTLIHLQGTSNWKTLVHNIKIWNNKKLKLIYCHHGPTNPFSDTQMHTCTSTQNLTWNVTPFSVISAKCSNET